jgi:inosine/xanthosine triphosphate pyrophosphatase family protein
MAGTDFFDGVLQVAVKLVAAAGRTVYFVTFVVMILETAKHIVRGFWHGVSKELRWNQTRGGR